MTWLKMENSLYINTSKYYYCINFNFFGLVAQMVDRRLGMAEAPGSNPGQSIFKIKINL